MKTPALLAALVLALSAVASGAGALSPAGSVSAVPAPAGSTAAGSKPAGSAGWSWPLNPKPTVLRAFDPPAKPWLGGHRGVDLEAASFGALVTAPASGTVSFVGVVVDRPVITIDHGDGLRSSFEPVASELVKGAYVAEGGMLGKILPAHCGPTPCVHWGVRRGENYVNPLAFVMDLRPSILLPPLDPAPGYGSEGRAGTKAAGDGLWLAG
ncbi:murein DD-endopeptidase MepM/ murein hydrolase activator NlpD [Arthrobacter sp. V4I6]|uniref:M23 family metallopeptidase n=1 Tax=unclassified Arthrobacter TaxID=235627 RepID=UPI0027816848|nr:MULTISPECIES: M23 family metallopeptidase [unclassified Arthrobacter]MDQ0821993.1 murein DD-endopeptidase MepM/ murein hydrolase activator NlpD [Arthrobacter sp. V1I7]MDQ0856262.1 murein DD-endopeptidase MepM/ murein hydrolase activator NlpD [Arthrobacter sp. V4I6]